MMRAHHDNWRGTSITPAADNSMERRTPLRKGHGEVTAHERRHNRHARLLSAPFSQLSCWGSPAGEPITAGDARAANALARPN